MKTPRTLAPLLTLATCVLAVGAAAAQTCTPVEVHNLRVGQGKLMLAAYENAADFGARSNPVAMQLAAETEVLRFSLCGLKGTATAITLYQDLNSNGKLDTGLFGIPSEPWGASGKSTMGPPSWESALVTVDGQPIVVKLR